MSAILNQEEKAILFRSLHQPESFLLLPNVWDPLGAALVEEMGFPAIATASAAIAFTSGYPDGEQLPFRDLLSIVKKIVSNTSLPVTVDMESGYASAPEELEANARELISLGIVGINLEDYDYASGRIYSIDEQTDRIARIRQVAAQSGIPVFINARTDVFLKDREMSPDEKPKELIKRGRAYIDAGADGFFPIGLVNPEQIAVAVSEVPAPVNILAFPGVPDLKTLKQLGVRRVSLGPGLLKMAVHSMKQVLSRLIKGEGLDEISGNEITTMYLSQLVQKK